MNNSHASADSNTEEELSSIPTIFNSIKKYQGNIYDDGGNWRSGNVYKFGGPFRSGILNYINLSSVNVYTVSVSTTVIDSITTKSENNDGQEIETLSVDKFISSSNNFDENPYYALANSIYTAGGVATSLGKLTYIGSAHQIDLAGPNVVTYVDGYNKVNRFETKFEDSQNENLYAESTNSTGFNNSSYGDMTFAEYSIVLWEGLDVDESKGIKDFTIFNNTDQSEEYDVYIRDNEYYIYSSDHKTVYIVSGTTVDSSTLFDDIVNYITNAYTFSGWYVQTQNNDNNIWSNFELFSTSLHRPFISAITTNINIVAVFSALTNVKISYNPNELNVSFASSLDSRGMLTQTNYITSEYYSISGWFNFVSDVLVQVSPVGGFRLGGKDGLYSVISSSNSTLAKFDLNSTSNPFGFMKYTSGSLVNVRNSQISLTEVNYFDVNLANYMKKCGKFVSNNNIKAESILDIFLESEFVVLTYFKVDDYFGIRTSDSGDDGYQTRVILYEEEIANPSNRTTLLMTKLGNTTNSLQYEVEPQRDNANNEIICRAVDGSTSLEFYGYFDRDKYTGSSATHRLIACVNTPNKSSQEYNAWMINGTNNGYPEVSNGYTIEGHPISGAKAEQEIKFFFNDESINNDYLLSSDNHVIHLHARKATKSALTIQEEFWAVNNGSLQKEETVTHSIPISFVYNIKYMEDGTLNGNFVYNQISPKTYEFTTEANDGTASGFIARAIINETYRYVYDGANYYMFVGFKVSTNHNEVISTQMMYTFNEAPDGTLTAIYIKILPIEINITSGGDYNITISCDAFTNVYRDISVSEIGIATNNYEEIENTFNFVLYGSRVEIRPIASANYELSYAAATKGGVNDPSVSVNSPNKVISNYNEKYTFSYGFSTTNIITIKQYLLSSTSQSSLASLYTDEYFTFLSKDELTNDQIINYISDINNKTTLNIANGGDFYIYFLINSSKSITGIYSNGKLLLSASDVSLIDSQDVGDGYSIKKIKYSSYNDSFVSGDISLDIRFSTIVSLRTEIVGIGLKSGSYPYETVFDESIYQDGRYIVASLGDENLYLTPSTNVTNGVEIAAGDNVNFNLNVLYNSKYSFVYYYYYAKYQLPEEKDGYYEIKIGNHTYLLKKTSNNTIEEPLYIGSTDATGQLVLLESGLYAKPELYVEGSTKYAMLETKIGNTPIASLIVDANMLSNMINDNLTIYAKFSEITTVNISKNITIHTDDLSYYDNLSTRNEFFNFFNAKIKYTNASRTVIEETLTYDIFEHSYKTITIAKDSEITITPYISSHVVNRYIPADVLEVKAGGTTRHNANLESNNFVIQTKIPTLISYTIWHLIS